MRSEGARASPMCAPPLRFTSFPHFAPLRSPPPFPFFLSLPPHTTSYSISALNPTSLNARSPSPRCLVSLPLAALLVRS